MDNSFYLVRHGEGFKKVKSLGPLPHPIHIKVRRALARGLSDRDGNRHIRALPTADAQAFA
jgi:hypothetical protein